MISKLEPTIWSSDTGHIGIHGGVDVRTFVRSHGDQFSRTVTIYNLTHGAPTRMLVTLLLTSLPVI